MVDCFFRSLMKKYVCLAYFFPCIFRKYRVKATKSKYHQAAGCREAPGSINLSSGSAFLVGVKQMYGSEACSEG